MKSHRSLWHVVTRTSGSVGGAPRKPSTRAVRAWATGAIIALALVLGSLGAAVLGHGSTGHSPASAHQPANGPALSAYADSIYSGYTRISPWMY